jgi:membrane protease YdiL (CAAX protease family)
MTYARVPQTSQPARTGGVRTIVRRYPTTTFFLLAFIITWAVWVPNVLAPESGAGTLAPFWSYGPATAAVIVAALTGTLRDLGARLVRWRVGWQWYAVVLLGPAAFCVTLAALYAVFGWSAELDAPNARGEGLIGLLPLFLALVLTDGLGEETGWRGFALPRMVERAGPIVASLVLGVLWALWHLPLFWTAGNPNYGESFVIMLIGLPAISVLYTWLFQHTAGSALLAILFHASGSVAVITLPAVSAVEAGTVRFAVVDLALKWVLAGAVGVYWMRRSRTADLVTQRPPGGA